MNYGDTRTLDFLYHRCAATSAGASGRGHNYAVNAGLFELLCVLGGESLRGCDGGAVTDGGIIQVVQLADLAFALKLAHYVYGQYAVGVLIGVYGIVTAVSGLVISRGELIEAVQAVLAIVGSGGGLNVVGVALGNNTAGGAQGDGSLAQILDGGIGATRSKEGMGYSVTKCSPLSFLSSIFTARLEPRSFSKKFLRMPLGI